MEYLGRVKWYDEVKGYGFVSSKDLGDVFLHVSNVPNTVKIEEELKLIFEVQETSKGLNATKIRIPDDDDISVLFIEFYDYLNSQLIDSYEEYEQQETIRYRRPIEDKYNFDSLIRLTNKIEYNYLVSNLLYKAKTDEIIQQHFRVFFFAVKTLVEFYKNKLNIQERQEKLDQFLLFAPSRAQILIWRNNEHILSININSYQRNSYRRNVEYVKSEFKFDPNSFAANKDLIFTNDSLEANYIRKISYEANRIEIMTAVAKAQIDSQNGSLDEIKVLQGKLSLIKLNIYFDKDSDQIINNISENWRGAYLKTIRNNELDVVNLKIIVLNIKEYLTSSDQKVIWEYLESELNEEEVFNLWKDTNYRDLPSNILFRYSGELHCKLFEKTSEKFKRDYFNLKIQELNPINSLGTFVSFALLYLKVRKYEASLPIEFVCAILLFEKSKEFLKKIKYCDSDQINSCYRAYYALNRLESETKEWAFEDGIRREYTDSDISILMPEIIEQSINSSDVFVKDILELFNESELWDLIDNVNFVPKYYYSSRSYDSNHFKRLKDRIKEKFVISDDLPSNYYSFLKRFAYQMPNAFYNLVWRTENVLPFDKQKFLSEFNLEKTLVQVSMFKRVFKEIQIGGVTKEEFLELSRDILSLQKVELNIKLCIQLLFKYDSEGFQEKTIYDVAAAAVEEDLNSFLSIDYFFDLCNGRKNYRNSKNQLDNWYAEVQGVSFLVNDKYILVGDETCYINKVNRTVVIDGKLYSFKWKKEEGYEYLHSYGIPDGIKFCDARFTHKDEDSGRLFHWCNNYPCFKANQKAHLPFQWESYTLRDFLQILGYQIDYDQYYRFLGTLNRAVRLLERLKCSSCHNLLRDAKSSGFAYYRVTTFKCTNSECASHNELVYLTHCLNMKCHNIVDNRISKRCSNGWTICDQCDSCCSQRKIASRYENLKINNYFDLNNPQHQRLEHQFINKAGHLERQEFFDYQTGDRKLNQVEPRKVKDKRVDDDLPF